MLLLGLVVGLCFFSELSFGFWFRACVSGVWLRVNGWRTGLGFGDRDDGKEWVYGSGSGGWVLASGLGSTHFG